MGTYNLLIHILKFHGNSGISFWVIYSGLFSSGKKTVYVNGEETCCFTFSQGKRKVLNLISLLI